MAEVFTGSKASFKINGVKVAFISSITVNVDNTLTDVDVIDQLEIGELAETAHKVNCTVNSFKVDQNAIKAVLGVDSDNPDTILSQPEVTIEVYDRENDKVQFTIEGAKYAGGSGSVDARGVWTGTSNWRGVRGFGL